MSKKGRHKTVDKELKQSMAWLESQPEIHRVILGLCESCRHKYSPGTIKIKQRVPGGLTLNAYGGSGIINVFIKIHENNIEFIL